MLTIFIDGILLSMNARLAHTGKALFAQTDTLIELGRNRANRTEYIHHHTLIEKIGTERRKGRSEVGQSVGIHKLGDVGLRGFSPDSRIKGVDLSRRNIRGASNDEFDRRVETYFASGGHEIFYLGLPLIQLERLYPGDSTNELLDRTERSTVMTITPDFPDDYLTGNIIIPGFMQLNEAGVVELATTLQGVETAILNGYYEQDN